MASLRDIRIQEAQQKLKAAEHELAGAHHASLFPAEKGIAVKSASSRVSQARVELSQAEATTSEDAKKAEEQVPPNAQSPSNDNPDKNQLQKQAGADQSKENAMAFAEKRKPGVAAEEDLPRRRSSLLSADDMAVLLQARMAAAALASARDAANVNHAIGERAGSKSAKELPEAAAEKRGDTADAGPTKMEAVGVAQKLLSSQPGERAGIDTGNVIRADFTESAKAARRETGKTISRKNTSTGKPAVRAAFKIAV